jgi:hypothetical protein
MMDLKCTTNGDLELTDDGDILATESVRQAVKIRLLWFFDEWRLGPELGFPYFEYVFIKNPNETKIKSLIRDTVMSVDEVTDVTEITYELDKQTRSAAISVEFITDEDTFREEVEIKWQTTD